MAVRGVVIAALVALSPVAHADPGLEATGFFGVDYFGPNIGLGHALAPEQIPQTSPMFGGRLTFLMVQGLHVDFGIEAEATFTPSWTGYGFDGPRMSYFSPVIGYRGHLMLRWHLLPWFAPHLLGGAGGETVISGSPFMSTGTDPVVYEGVGLTIALSPGWKLRLDARQGWMPARGGGMTATYEGLAGIGTTFGERPPPRHPIESEPHPRPIDVPVVPVDGDRDHDGVLDSVDACPDQAGVASNRGCPEPDPDGDGIVGANDKCPNEPEDFDHFQDDDGCPDPDNDHDGFLDAVDKCPNDPETRNGYQDEDGCPDEVPANILAAFSAATAARFEHGRARLSDAAKLALEKTIAVLRANPTMHVRVTGHPAKGDAEDLAKKRAEVVKWYIVEKGIPEDQLDTVVGDEIEAKGPPIQLTTAPK